MRRAFAAMVGVLLVAGLPVLAHAQGSQAPDPQERDPSAQNGLPENPLLAKVHIDRGGGVHLTDLFSVVFGGIKQGSSLALGPALSHDFADGSFVQVKGVYSIRNFKLLQARYDSRPVFSRRAIFSTRVRWQDAPQLSLYAIGPLSGPGRAEYGERKVEWSGFLRAGVAAHLTVTAGSGLERYAIDSGFIDLDEDERLGIVPDAPGLSTRPWFVHSFASAAYDTRLSPDYSRTGTALDLGLHDFHDMHDGAASFRGLEIGAAHLFPTVQDRAANAGAAEWKGALEISGRAWLTYTGEGQAVPFFLMPTLGGGDFLRGYASYRFRDRNALLLKAEYRWAVHPLIDVAALYEAGAVAPTTGGLGGDAMAQSVGGGLRLHSKTSGLMRVDLARGRDGVHFSIGFALAAG